jgi:ATP-dependent DNA helicase PIF1
MLLRNLDLRQGLCNGTRLIVQDVVSGGRLLMATVAATGATVLLPRIKLIPDDADFPFRWSRRQFPVRLAFATTINKSQGQTLSRVGVVLGSGCFAHGQLYDVAASRVGSPDHVRFALADYPPSCETRNPVYRRALLL